jgi:superfamily II DNA/RNA helicase
VHCEPRRRGDDYLHRTGRTGRAGEKGLAIALVAAPDWNRMESIERYLRLDLEPRSVPGIRTRFEGPTKRRGGHKPSDRPVKSKADAHRVKERERDRKNIGKRRKPSADAAKEAGFGPPRRKEGEPAT